MDLPGSPNLSKSVANTTFAKICSNLLRSKDRYCARFATRSTHYWAGLLIVCFLNMEHTEQEVSWFYCHALLRKSSPRWLPILLHLPQSWRDIARECFDPTSVGSWELGWKEDWDRVTARLSKSSKASNKHHAGLYSVSGCLHWWERNCRRNWSDW